MYNSAPTEYSENMAPPNSIRFPEKLQNALFFLAIMLVQHTMTFYYTLTLLMP